MTAVGAAALGLAWGWLAAAVLPRPALARSVAAVGAATAALAAEAALVAGAASALAVIAGTAVGAAGQRAWQRMLRARVENA